MTRLSHKPVRSCHACPLNLGDHCWGYSNPREQWARRRGCPGIRNVSSRRLYDLWRKQAAVKSRREIRRECIHHRPPERIYFLEKGRAARLREFLLSLAPD